MRLHKAVQIRVSVYGRRSVGQQSRQVDAFFKNMSSEKLPMQNCVLLLE
jgi:hypothetical protein